MQTIWPEQEKVYCRATLRLLGQHDRSLSPIHSLPYNLFSLLHKFALNHRKTMIMSHRVTVRGDQPDKVHSR